MADKFLRSGGRGEDGTAKPFRTNNNGDQYVQLTGSRLQEQKTEVDASSGVVTFSSDIQAIEIYNRDTTDGVFTVNNIDITVPADESFQATVGGTPSNEVSVSGSTSYIIGRYA